MILGSKRKRSEVDELLVWHIKDQLPSSASGRCRVSSAVAPLSEEATCGNSFGAYNSGLGERVKRRCRQTTSESTVATTPPVNSNCSNSTAGGVDLKVRESDLSALREQLQEDESFDGERVVFIVATCMKVCQKVV